MGRKSPKRGSNSSVNSGKRATDGQIKDAIDALRKAMEAGFAGLHSNMVKLRYEFKREVKETKQGLNFHQCYTI